MAKTLYNGKATVQVISNMGLLVADSANSNNVGKRLAEAFSGDAQAVAKSVKAGEPYVSMSGEMIEVAAPIALGRTGTPWSILISVDRTLVFAEAEALNQVMSEDADSNVMVAVSAGRRPGRACLPRRLAPGQRHRGPGQKGRRVHGKDRGRRLCGQPH